MTTSSSAAWSSCGERAPVSWASSRTEGACGRLVAAVALICTSGACADPRSAVDAPSTGPPGEPSAVVSTAPERLPPAGVPSGADRPDEGQDVDALLAHAAYELLDLGRGHPLVTVRPERLDLPASSGSLMKIATLAAAIDAGVVDDATRLVCRRSARVDGRVLDCSHPGAGSSLSGADALAHSCNSFFLDIGGRLSREQLSAARVAFGVPPVSAGASLPLAAVGLDGVAVAPRAWPRAIARLARGDVAVSLSSRRVLLDGLERATRVGTASGLGDLAERVLAKTGTAPGPGGQVLGVIAAVWPADSPTTTLVLLAPGASGRDAAALAGEVVRRLDRAQARRATLRVGRLRDTRYVVESMSLEDYVAGVVAAEAPPGAPPPLEEVLAVLARTYGWAHRGRHEADGFDVCDLTHCQALARPTVGSSTAAAASQGRVLMHQSALAEVYYSASCGGWLEEPRAIWPAASRPGVPYLSRRPDPAAHPPGAWTSELAVEELEEALRAAGLRGARLEHAQVIDATVSGRARRVRVAGFVPEMLTGEDLRLAVGRHLGWQRLKSTRFTIERTARGFRFEGSGHGHGVGLCVLGAATLVGRGARVADVLTAYLPGTRIAHLDEVQSGSPLPARPPPGRGGIPRAAEPVVGVSLPFADEKSRPAADTAVRRALAHVASFLAVPPPPRLVVRFHPTVRSYQRTTRLPWWTSGATVDGQIELPPFETLRRRGTMAQTLRHEVVHLLSAEALAGRPLWVKEGLAAHVAGQGREEKVVSRDAPACPADAEFARASSGEALRALYERAEICVARELARGTPWERVGAVAVP
jgi:SpoIID/LytB domain protein